MNTNGRRSASESKFRVLFTTLRRRASEPTYQALRRHCRAEVARMVGARNAHIDAIAQQVVHDLWAKLHIPGLSIDAVVTEELPAALSYWGNRAHWKSAAARHKTEPARMSVREERRVNRARRLDSLDILKRLALLKVHVPEAPCSAAPSVPQEANTQCSGPSPAGRSRFMDGRLEI